MMSAAEDAERLLRQVWVDESDRIPLPIDPIRIAHTLGIRVFESPLDENVSGLLIKKQNDDPSIYLNHEDHVNRQRFTCAHEIGHWVRHREEEFQYVDRRDLLSAAGVDPEETYANAFGAALLMPLEHVKEFREQDLRDYEMAARFKVSLEAMRNRLENLQLA